MEKFDHLNRQIPPEAHTSMYNFHKYWSRKTWNVVGQYIETYCPEGGIVFDPFGGSGVTAIEALKRGRRAIICDLSPISTELIRLTIKNASLTGIQESFDRIKNDVSKKINNLYLTTCKNCGHIFPFDCSIWKDNKCTSIRYSNCPNCGRTNENGSKPSSFDKEKLNEIDRKKINLWYPANRFYYPNNNPFVEKQKFESVDELFTKRNLYALALLMNSIEKEKSKTIRDFLKIGFSSMVHLCTKMTPVRPTRPLSSAWTEHSYWYANEFMEQNVWSKFESSIIGKQGLLKAKIESNGYFSKVKFAKKFQEVIDKKADIFIYTGSCLDLMKEMKKFYQGKGFIDYIFTDPPYGSSIQYGELSYLWVSWLKLDDKYLDKVIADEIIINERQDKNFEVYHSLLRNSFEGMFDVLNPGKYLTLTFHNPTFKIRNATIRAGVLSGFELQKIHHQELARSSAKSLLQPFGSAQGDFYLRFQKSIENNFYAQERIDEIRFEKIVLDTTIRIIAERGEPTPYTIIINAIDPELAKRGYFTDLKSGMDVKTVLEKHLKNEFILVNAKIGGISGKLWWFKNPALVPHLQTVPLSERVEKTVLTKLQQMGKVSFTDIWESVSIEFPNSLTSDQTSIKTALEAYANKRTGGYWLIKPNFKKEYVENEHTTLICLLAKIGIQKGYKIYIGKNEQSHFLNSPLVKESGHLRQFVDYPFPKNLTGITNHETVDDIDVLWIKDNKVTFMFEVESTTTMTSALHRGSNLPKETKKVMLYPVERDNQFKQKMKSPMFYNTFVEYNWSTIIFGNLYEEWNKNKINSNIESIFDKPNNKKSKNHNFNNQIENNQIELFEY